MPPTRGAKHRHTQGIAPCPSAPIRGSNPVDHKGGIHGWRRMETRWREIEPAMAMGELRSRYRLRRGEGGGRGAGGGCAGYSYPPMSTYRFAISVRVTRRISLAWPAWPKAIIRAFTTSAIAARAGFR